MRCETRLYNGLDAALRPLGIAASQYEFLRYLHAHPGARTADIAVTFAIGVGATSKGAARLEAKGWVTRTPNPTDARSALLDLTPAGADLYARAHTVFAQFLTPLLAEALPAGRVAATASALNRLRLRLEADGVGIPAG